MLEEFLLNSYFTCKLICFKAIGLTPFKPSIWLRLFSFNFFQIKLRKNMAILIKNGVTNYAGTFLKYELKFSCAYLIKKYLLENDRYWKLLYK